MKKYLLLAVLFAGMALGIGFLLNGAEQCIELSNKRYDNVSEILRVREQIKRTFSEKLIFNQAPVVHAVDTVLAFKISAGREVLQLKTLSTSGFFEIDKAAQVAIQEIGPTLTPSQCYVAKLHYDPQMVATGNEGIVRVSQGDLQRALSADDKTSDMVSYITTLKRSINQEWQNQEAFSPKTDGMLLSMEIQKSGQLKSVWLINSSGKPAIDQAAIRMVQAMAPFKPLPTSYAKDLYAGMIWVGQGYELQPADQERYLEVLRTQLRSKWDPPSDIGDRKVQVNIVINRIGRVQRVELVQSSGLDALDHLAVTTAKALDPFQALPPYFKPDTMGILWTFTDKPREATAAELHYVDEVKQRLDKLWFPPAALKDLSVEVRFRVQRNGHLASVEISRSSGVLQMDNIALATVQKAAPFQPIPQNIQRDSLGIIYLFGKADLLDDKETQLYREALKRSIMSHWNPSADIMNKLVIVNFTVDRLARLQKVSIKQSSGSQEADETALTAVRAATLPSFAAYSNQPTVNVDWKFGSTHELKNGSFQVYRKQMRRRIIAAWYPPEALGSRKVEIFFQLERNGHIRNLKLAKSSGSLEIDQAALAAIRNAEPLPVFPEDYKKEVIDVIWSFDKESKTRKES